jgi:diguanylate cyclase (GGDEF)-like protein/PAS domain S-box-containing protein
MSGAPGMSRPLVWRPVPVEDQKVKRRLGDRSWAVGVALVAAVIAVFAVLLAADSGRRHDREAAQERQALLVLRMDIADVLRREVALARVVGAFDGRVARRWPQLAGIVLGQGLANGAGFFEPVAERDRAVWQRTTGLRMVQSPRPGVVVPAPPQPLHLVLRANEQRIPGPPPLGLDVAGDPLRRRLLLHAAATWRQLATPPITFLGRSAVTGVLVVAPARSAHGRLLGWVSTAYSATGFADEAADPLTGVRFAVRDGANILIADPRATAAGMPAQVDVAGRTWTVRAFVPPAAPAATPWIVLGLGLALALGFTLLLQQAVARRRYAMGLVEQHVAAEREQRAEVERERRAMVEAQAIARVGSWSWDPTSGGVVWSPQMYRIFGRPVEQGPALGEAFLAYVHADDRERVGAGFRAGFAAGVAWKLDFRIVRDGETCCVHAIGHAEPSGAYVGTVQDVTRTRRVEEALRAAEERFRKAFEEAPIGMALVAPDGRFLRVNRELCAIVGYPEPELMRGTFQQITHPDDLEADLAFVAQMLAGEIRTYSMEKRYLHKDGHVVWAHLSVSLQRDEDERPVQFISQIADITEQKHAAAALAEAEERFRSAFEGAPIGLVLLDPVGRFAEVNDAFCAIVGYGRQQLLGIDFNTITHPEDAAEDGRVLHELLAGQRSSLTSEKRFLHGEGHAVHCAVQATVLRAGDGSPANVLAHVQDVTERKRHEQQLQYLADHDALTGLLNRRAFNRALQKHAELVERYGPAGSIVVIDLDQFKYVNDTLGHHAGDQLIVAAATLLARRLRATDVLARLGGDEFGVLLPKAGPAAAELVAQGLLQTLRGAAIATAGVERTITASIGVASFEHARGAGAEEVLVNADLAMYDAKEEGRNCVATFTTTPDADVRMKGHITWAQRVTAALDEDRFTLLAQPIVDLATGEIRQYELLLRMRDERGELIPPAAFLLIAERLRLIQQIDTWVITHAIAHVAEHQTDHPDIAFEINLSAASLGDNQVLEHIEHELARSEVDPARVIFEITETAALTSFADARTFAERLAELGCRFALDDFGAGFGSFSYLKHLHFDYIKIDGDFVRGCQGSTTDQLLIRAIVDIARGLEKHTIAEYVSDEETVALLARIGVDYGQGYHLGRPAPLAEQLAVRRP